MAGGAVHCVKPNEAILTLRPKALFMAIFNKPSPSVARTMWNVWLGVALFTLLVIVITGLFTGLTFSMMAIVVAGGTVVWLVPTLWLFTRDQRSQSRRSPSVMDRDLTVRLKHG